MNDLTQGSILRHLVKLAVPISIGMVFQTLYYLVDLYFVAQLGDQAIAGVGAAGNLQFLVIGLTQVLSVGTMALIAQAVGRKDPDDAQRIFDQSLQLSLAAVATLLVIGYGLGTAYIGSLGADAGTTRAGLQYLFWVLPGMALQFTGVSLAAALRGTGIEKPSMVIQMLTVVLNAILSPILIVGWGTGRPLGVVGAGLATTLSVAIGVALLWVYFLRADTFVQIRRPSAPDFSTWRRILGIGLPPGGEFGLMFVYISVIYFVTQGFGASAQAGFGVGSRVMQAVFLPAMAVAFATAPVAGQNFGAGHFDRVRRTFYTAAGLGSTIMLTLTLLSQWRPTLLVSGFSDDAAVIEVATDFLRIISWNFVASGLIFTCSGIFQALGNTLPALYASGTRLVTFVIPALWISTQPSFELHHLWYISVASVGCQALISLYLLRGTLARKLSAG